MTPQDLIAAFDTLADAPDGVKRLRELVLSLAVTGKLVGRSPDDGDAADLLRRIGSERSAVEATLRTRRPKVLPSRPPDIQSWSIDAGGVVGRIA